MAATATSPNIRARGKVMWSGRDRQVRWLLPQVQVLPTQHEAHLCLQGLGAAGQVEGHGR